MKTRQTSSINSLIILCLSIIFLVGSGCSGGNSKAEDLTKKEEWKPLVTKIVLNEIDTVLVEKGKKLYESKCISCHNLKNKMIGPAFVGITNRRSPEWIMNMILSPKEMVENDKVAKKLLEEYRNVVMTDQKLTEQEAREILEYFRTIN